MRPQRAADQQRADRESSRRPGPCRTRSRRLASGGRSCPGAPVGAALPRHAAPAMMVQRRADRRRHVEHRDQRQERRPERRTAGSAATSAGTHHAIAAQAAAPIARAAPCPAIAASGGTSQVSAIAEHATRQQQRRIAKLHVGGARHHAPDVGRHADTAATERASALWPSQIRPPCFTAAASATSSISAPRTACDAADPPQRAAPDQDRPAGRRRGRAQRIVHPGERIQQLEEEHEGRDQRALPASSRRTAPPSRRPGRSRRARLRHQRREMAPVMHDVGVGQQDQLGALGRRDPLRHRP